MKASAKETRELPPPSWVGYLRRGVKRLDLRAIFLGDLTADSLRRAGVERGMRVLDLGCGTGDTSLLIAALVGPTGLVVGVDPSARAIDAAERAAVLSGQCYWTRFVVADLDAFVPPGPLDVIVVRLRHLRDPVATCWQLSAHIRPGGIIAIMR